MMKPAIIILMAITTVVTSGIANTQNKTIPRFAKFDVSAVANFGPGCRIRFSIPEKSDLKAYYGSEENLGSGGLRVLGMPYQEDRSLVAFNCYRADDGFVKEGWASQKNNGDWRPNKDNEITELISLKAFHYYDLISKNARGWAVAVDDTFGDEKFRRRQFSYCLVKKSKAICGQNFVGYLSEIKKNKRADLTPYILDLLRSVEFLGDALPQNSGNEKP